MIEPFADAISTAKAPVKDACEFLESIGEHTFPQSRKWLLGIVNNSRQELKVRLFGAKRLALKLAPLEDINQIVDRIVEDPLELRAAFLKGASTAGNEKANDHLIARLEDYAVGDNDWLRAIDSVGFNTASSTREFVRENQKMLSQVAPHAYFRLLRRLWDYGGCRIHPDGSVTIPQGVSRYV